MEFLREWLISVTAGAIMVSIAKAVTPEGPVKKTVRCAGGLIMLLICLSPLVELSESDFSSYISKYELLAEFDRTGIEVENLKILSEIVREKTEEAIEAKAAELGFACEATVTTKTGASDYPYPHSAELICRPDETQRELLAAYLESGLAIPGERQQWKTK